MKPLVKICGVTRLQDAQVAVEAGADFLGFIRAPKSPRYLEPGAIAAITRELPEHVRTVAVFVNAPLDDIRRTVEAAAIDIIQLHGDEPDGFTEALGRDRVWRVVHLGTSDDVTRAATLDCAAILADSATGGMRGGTGQVGDWTLAAALAVQRRMVLAGGLRSENVAEAVRAVHPWAVDVSSGVEREPGIKDPDRLRTFVRAAKRG